MDCRDFFLCGFDVLDSRCTCPLWEPTHISQLLCLCPFHTHSWILLGSFCTFIFQDSEIISKIFLPVRSFYLDFGRVHLNLFFHWISLGTSWLQSIQKFTIYSDVINNRNLRSIFCFSSFAMFFCLFDAVS